MSFTYRHTLTASYLGYVTQSVTNIYFPLLFTTFHDKFNISLSAITFLVTLNFLTQLAVDFFSAKFVDKIGYRNLAVFAHLSCAAGLLSMAFLPFLLPAAYIGLLVSVFLCAVGSGIIEVLINPIVESVPSKNKAASMSLLHSFYCWGCVGVVILATLFFSVFGRENWFVLTALWAILPLFNALFFTRVPINAGRGETFGIRGLLASPLFVIFIVLMAAAGASEQAMAQWVSYFAESALNVTKSVGDILGICLFSALMGLSRSFYAAFGSKIRLLPFIFVSGIFLFGAYIAAALGLNPAVSLLACALSGLFVGIMWPGVISVASASFPLGGSAMFALLALAGDLGCTGGPTLLGCVSHLFGDNMSLGILSASIFPLVLIIFSLYLLKKMKGKQ